MTAFDLAVAAILNSEGVWSNVSGDAGGKTKFGIAEGVGTLDEAKRRGLVQSDRRIEDLTEVEARLIYRVMYWNEVKGDRLPMPIALAVFDAAVNIGPYFAITALQKALGVDVDGIVGPETLGAAGKAPADLLDRMLEDRAMYHFRRTIEKPSQTRFLRGWIRRCFRTARQAAEVQGMSV